MGATNRGHQTQPMTSKQPLDLQKAGRYQMRAEGNYADRSTGTHSHYHFVSRTHTHFDLTFYLFKLALWPSSAFTGTVTHEIRYHSRTLDR